MNNKPILGVLLGDATGVGPELVARLAVNDFYKEHCRPIVIGDMRVFEKGLEIVKGDVAHYAISDVSEADWSRGIPVLDQKDQDPAKITLCEINADCGKASVNMLKVASNLCKEGKIDGFAFAPFNKSAMIEGGCTFESEHHLLAHIFGVSDQPFGEINMLGDLMTTRTTSHIPISAVSEHLTEEKILRAIRLANATATASGIAKPKLGVCGLNPHNGENGRCGREELDVIAPAVAKAQEMGIDAQGPFPADTLFIKAFKGAFDGVVTMFHDQGQIALKLRGFDEGITVAGGQPYAIATCAHGTAYDITGKGIASSRAFENAVKMTGRMAQHTAK